MHYPVAWRIMSLKTHHAVLRYVIYMLLAELAFNYKDDSQGLDFLTRAMRGGRQKDYVDISCLNPDRLCELCILALNHHIETAYVQRLIKVQKLYPKSSPFDVKNWPWQLKIYTMGRFSIVLNGAPLPSTGKAHGKPVELVKVLVALGGRDVSESALCEALWPDAEGDQAHSAFTTTLSRCRKLFGKPLLQLNNAQLSLNDQLCWVDSWAFERNLGELESLLGQNDSLLKQQIQLKVNGLFELYHGLFLEKEPGMSWVLPHRERLRAKFMRIIKLLIQFYRDTGGHCKKVIILYEKARELDPMSEEYCRGLMRCHAAQGNRPEALAIFERCHSILTESFGIQPSTQTTDLYQLIKTGEQQKISGLCDVCNRASK